MILKKALRRLNTCEAALRSPYKCFSTSSRRATPHLIRRSISHPHGRIIFSGIQPTGVPHLGNYLGALRPWVELQNSSKHGDFNYFCVVDLHALTVSQDPKTLSRWRKESFASLLAVGLDAKKSHIFFQSEVAAHSELMWLLSTIASTGYLSRMTQWKSKLDLSDNASMEDDKSREKLKLGLFSYPVLQAADILLYNTTHVPVGADQVQHLEFTRSIANSFNSLYDTAKTTFVLPQGIISPAQRIMSLRNPTKKMSKSDADANSRILITDTPGEIRGKIKTAVTDSEEGISYDPDKRPGISNLVDILKYASGNSLQASEIAQENQNLSKKVFKELVAEAVISCLSGIRDNYESALLHPEIAAEAAERGARAARRVSRLKMSHVHQAMGIQPNEAAIKYRAAQA